MKKLFPVAIAALLTVVAVLSFQLTYSQLEPGDDWHLNSDKCTCRDRRGNEIVFGTYDYCEQGGTTICSPSDCLYPPIACM